MHYDIILQLCFPRISPHGGLFERVLICTNDLLCGGLFEGAYSEVGLIRGFTVCWEKIDLSEFSTFGGSALPRGLTTKTILLR